MKNPFADYGRAIYGNRFIGRRQEIQAVKNRIFDERYGNLAIIGLPRIGKSSLAHQAIVEYQLEFPQLNILSIWLNMGDNHESNLFFEKLIKETHKKLLLDKSLITIELVKIIKKFNI
jgi:AAA+ ATPase superfamily predicted ATPase